MPEDLALLELGVPLYVFALRENLTVQEALCAYLVLDPAGPQLTHAQAADALGLKARQQIGVYIARAREDADDFGPCPWRKHGFPRAE